MEPEKEDVPFQAVNLVDSVENKLSKGGGSFPCDVHIFKIMAKQSHNCAAFLGEKNEAE